MQEFPFATACEAGVVTPSARAPDQASVHGVAAHHGKLTADEDDSAGDYSYDDHLRPRDLLPLSLSSAHLSPDFVNSSVGD